MATLTPSRRIALMLAAAAAVAAPILAFQRPDPRPGRALEAQALPALIPPPLQRTAPVATRPLFASEATTTAAPVDAPRLVGIIGRLGVGGDAVALVRTRTGATNTLSPGDSADGWRLVSLAADAALFAQGERRVRVALAVSPPGSDSDATSDPDAAPDAEDQ